MDVVRKILLSQTIGDEWPRPGSAVFQTTFLSAPHSTGRFRSSETPRLRGPRHCGQFEPPSRDWARVLKPPAMLTINNNAWVKCDVFIRVGIRQLRGPARRRGRGQASCTNASRRRKRPVASTSAPQSQIVRVKSPVKPCPPKIDPRTTAAH